MKTRDLFLQADDGVPLFATDSLIEQSKPEPAAHAVDPKRINNGGGIVIMHGLGEHSGRYAHVVRFLNECGWSVRTYDHRGHGRSGGTRGDLLDKEAILRDAKIVIDDFARQLATPPLLLGHSLGGLWAAHFATMAMASSALSSPLSGLILSSPALALRLNAPQRWLLKFLGVVAPGIALPNGLSSSYLSHDRAVVSAYNNDPLVHQRITARLLIAMLKAMDFSLSHAGTLTIPTLLLVSGDDHAVDPAGSKTFFSELASGIGTMHLYPDLYHEIFNELDARPVFADLKAWLRARQNAQVIP